MTLSKIIKNYAVIKDEAYTIPVTQPDYESIDFEFETETDDENPEISEDTDETEQKSDINPGEEPEDKTDAHVSHSHGHHVRPADILAEREKELERERLREEIINQAKEQAQRTSDIIVNHTLETARTELNNALMQGYSDGFEAGRNEAVSIIAPALDKIRLLADSVTKAQDMMLEDFKDEMFDIIGEISQKILQREIDEKDEYLLTLFDDALKNIKAENFVTVTVSETQAGFALRNIDLFKAKIGNIEDFKIIPDKNAERGTMIVETEKTVADASFSVQMEEIDAILENMKENMAVPDLSDVSDLSDLSEQTVEFDESLNGVSDDELYGGDDLIGGQSIFNNGDFLSGEI